MQIPEFIIGTIITTTNIICCAKSLYALKKKPTAKEIQTKIKLACCVIVIMFAIQSIIQLTSSGVLIFCVDENYENDEIRWNIYGICTGILWILYPLSFLSLYLLFGIKLIEAFEDSVIQVSKLNKKIFYSSIILQWICYIIALIMA